VHSLSFVDGKGRIVKFVGNTLVLRLSVARKI